MTTLSQRELNRATLARQFLLERTPLKPINAIERLGALQAQAARSPFVALWSRVEAFDANELRDLIVKGRVVKSTLMRATLHLTTARDYLSFRPALHDSLGALASSMVKARLQDVTVDDILATAREIFADEPLTFAEAFRLLEERFPGSDSRALGYVARLNLPLVQIPSDTRWSFPAAPARFGLAERWLKRPIAETAPPDDLVMRYLGALGPATVADITNWTKLKGVRPVIDRLRDRLVTFANEAGQELFDLPDAPHPPADTPAPVRFLPEFDNVVLSGADRSRFMTKDHQRAIFTNNLAYAAVFLVDGAVTGAWRLDRKKALEIEPFETLKASVRDEVAAEGAALLSFLEPGATAVRFVER